MCIAQRIHAAPPHPCWERSIPVYRGDCHTRSSSARYTKGTSRNFLPDNLSPQAEALREEYSAGPQARIRPVLWCRHDCVDRQATVRKAHTMRLSCRYLSDPPRSNTWNLRFQCKRQSPRNSLELSLTRIQRPARQSLCLVTC